ncbi:hypothetical protein TRFO_40659 [Tritrichomonas foetus]|uniref:Initiator binding domain-containing protein n=1 Tax=Tritrichomonas foetus TaxID=1144522 RepID=A0A1J4J4E7_9EUKA|nr:hypothetical protein TRFO_40659 [Tritrichomonas foetus]|eukprot:OHS93023.1 hypothetical protein TRFO_40659 [Tritrichomonas foetus]
MNTSYDPIDSIRSIIETHFNLLRRLKVRQTSKDQITKELLFIVQKVIEFSDNPKLTLRQLGMIIFPGCIAIHKGKIVKLLSLCKSGFNSRMMNAGWSSEVYCPTNVNKQLKKIVKENYKYWCLKSMPQGSEFSSFVSEHCEIISSQKYIQTEEDIFSVVFNASQISSPLVHIY